MDLCSVAKAKKIQTVKETVDSLNKHITGHSTVVLANFECMTVSDMNALRAEARNRGVKTKVIKAKLLKRALASVKNFASLADLCTGQIMLICSENSIAAASVATSLGKKLIPIAGYLEDRVFDSAIVSKLGDCKSVNMVYAKVAFAIKVACSHMARVIRAVAAKRTEADR